MDHKLRHFSPSSRGLWFSIKLRLSTILRMGFIMEFAENLVLRLMEDPNERDRKFREDLYERKEACKRTIEDHRLPLRPYGFWTFERHNAQIFWDEQISQVQGRRDPYDDLIEEYSRPPAK